MAFWPARLREREADLHQISCERQYFSVGKIFDRFSMMLPPPVVVVLLLLAQGQESEPEARPTKATSRPMKIRSAPADREYFAFLESVLSADEGDPLREVEAEAPSSNSAVHMSEEMSLIKSVCQNIVLAGRKQQKLAFQQISILLSSLNAKSLPEKLLASAVAHMVERIRSSEIEAILSISIDNARFAQVLSGEGQLTNFKRVQAMAWLEVLPPPLSLEFCRI